MPALVIRVYAGEAKGVQTQNFPLSLTFCQLSVIAKELAWEMIFYLPVYAGAELATGF